MKLIKSISQSLGNAVWPKKNDSITKWSNQLIDRIYNKNNQDAQKTSKQAGFAAGFIFYGTAQILGITAAHGGKFAIDTLQAFAGMSPVLATTTVVVAFLAPTIHGIKQILNFSTATQERLRQKPLDRYKNLSSMGSAPHFLGSLAAVALIYGPQIAFNYASKTDKEKSAAPAPVKDLSADKKTVRYLDYAPKA